MFSDWFSGVDRERYRTSAYKQRIDHIGSSLLKLRYASEVLRQHLHEWLRFAVHLEKSGSGPLPPTRSGAVRKYLARLLSTVQKCTKIGGQACTSAPG